MGEADPLIETQQCGNDDHSKEILLNPMIKSSTLEWSDLTKACHNLKMNSNEFEALYIDAINSGTITREQNWYYWEPIHFVAKQHDLNKLEIILHHIQIDQLNSLTVFSENALHVLLEYGNRPGVLYELTNGWESRCCQVVPPEMEDVVRGAQLLIEAGININHTNLWNESALIIAIRFRLSEVIKLLLQNSQIDLDTACDRVTGQSARDWLRSHYTTPINSMSISLSTSETLFVFLKSANEDMFLRYNNEDVRKFVKALDGGYDNSITGTMLQVCLMKGYMDYVKVSQNIQLSEEHILKSKMMKIFCQFGFSRCVQNLLDNNADPLWMTQLGGLNILQLAVKFNYFPFVAVILGHRKPQITCNNLIDIVEFAINAHNFSLQNSNTRFLIELLLSKLDALNIDIINRRHQKVLNNLLDQYLLADGHYQDDICMLLKLGATLNVSSLSKLPLETLKSHLDECIDQNGNVCYDTLIIDDSITYSETELVRVLSHDRKKEELLNHPALIHLIHSKWLKTAKIFYINLALYALFVIFLFFYMIALQISVPISNWLIYSFMALLLIQAIKEVIQLMLFFPRYFKNVSNYLEISVIVCSVINLFMKNEHTMIIAILLSSSILLLTLGQLPQFAKYTIVFSSTKYFLQYAAFYMLQFVSFALCFYIMFNKNNDDISNSLESIFVQLFDTLVHFIGQYDGDVANPPTFPIFGRIIVAIFIFCMTIILNNLLVGLIVTDMDVIQKNGKLQRQIKMIRYIHRVETFLDNLTCGLFHPIKNALNTRLFSCDDEEESITQRKKFISNISNWSDEFDEEDKTGLKNIQKNRGQKVEILRTVCERINKEIHKDRHVSKENVDILLMLKKLEDRLRKMKMKR